jgi:hypothetical protein
MMKGFKERLGLEKRYKKETGKDAYVYCGFSEGYEEDYIKWLENKVIELEKEVNDLQEYRERY